VGKISLSQECLFCSFGESAIEEGMKPSPLLSILLTDVVLLAGCATQPQVWKASTIAQAASPTVQSISGFQPSRDGST
jgi:uncharacterized lipoprotein YajG